MGVVFRILVHVHSCRMGLERQRASIDFDIACGPRSRCASQPPPGVPAATEAAATDSGLVAAYAFDEESGTTVTDASGNGNNGTISKATWSTSGKYGDALQFNGTNALVSIPDAASLNLSSAMTLEAWVDPSTVDDNWRDVIYKANDSFYLEATSTSSSYPDAGLIAGGSYGDAFGTAACRPIPGPSSPRPMTGRQCGCT